MHRRNHVARLVVFSLLTIGGVASSGEAASLVLADQNSIIEVDPASQSGMHTWQVDGSDNLFQRWFWFRIGSIGPESSIDTISPATVTGFGGSSDGRLTYENAALRVEVKYSLMGGAPGSLDSDLGEQIRITNKTTSTFDFHFFEYTDFDLAGTAGNDTAMMVSPTAVVQTDGVVNIGASESLTPTPAPTHHEINIFSATRDSLNDAVATTLGDSPGPVGPGDVTWAFQWDIALAPGGSILISKSLKDTPIAPVPEPASLLIFGVGIVALRRLERRRRLER